MAQPKYGAQKTTWSSQFSSRDGSQVSRLARLAVLPAESSCRHRVREKKCQPFIVVVLMVIDSGRFEFPVLTSTKFLTKKHVLPWIKVTLKFKLLF